MNINNTRLFFLLVFGLFVLSFDSLGQEHITVNITNPCPSVGDGEIELIIETEDYSPPFEFTLTNVSGDPLDFGSGDEGYTFQGLIPGIYIVTVESDDGCNAVSGELVVEPQLTIENLTPICICEWGSAELEVSGGSGNYSYAWASSEFPGWVYSIEEVPIIPPPSFGSGPYSHTVTVTDNETGCQATASFEIGYCNGIDLGSFIEVTPDCNEEGTSTISVELPSATAVGPFEFRWTKVGVGMVEFDPSLDGTASLENAAPGEYCLNLLTMNGCEETVCGIMVESMPVPTVTYDISPIGGGNWILSTEVTGGSGSYSSLWNDDDESSDPSITVDETDDYFVTVTDDVSSCTTVTSVEMVSCNEMEQYFSVYGLEAQVTPISSGGSLGAIDITNTGDLFPGYDFSYTWSNGEGTEDIDGLASGIYDVTVTSEDCGFTAPFDGWKVCGFSVDFEVWPTTGCDFATLRAVILPEDDYSIEWNDPAQSTTEQIFAQYGVEYCVTVSIGFAPDECEATACITPEPIPMEIELVNITHASSTPSGPVPTGYIEVNVDLGPFAGLTDLAYVWSNGTVGPVNTGLLPGPYTVTVTDDCGNTATETYLIQCDLLDVDMNALITDVDCSSNNGGAVDLTVIPDNPNYAYTWSNGSTEEDVTDLAAGQYCVTVTDGSSGCVAVNCFEVGASGEGNFDVTFESVQSCNGSNAGQLTAYPANHSYQWSGFSWSTFTTEDLGTEQTITNLSQGVFHVTVTDAMGCSVSETAWMYASPPTFTAQPVEDPILVCPGNTGTAEIVVSAIMAGPYSYPLAPPYTYTWRKGLYGNPIETGEDPTLPGLTTGLWTVTVTDGNGCRVFTSFYVLPTDIHIYAEIGDECGEGSIELTPAALGSNQPNPPYTFLWADGNTDQNRYGLEEGNFCVTVSDAIGCTSSKCFEVNLTSTSFEVIAAVEDNGCGEECSGSIELSIDPPIAVTYEWADGNYSGSTNNRYFLCPGEYAVTVTSQESGCEVTETYTVEQAGGENFEYEVEVLAYFGNSINIFGSAVVNIQSELFEFPGKIDVFQDEARTQSVLNQPHSVDNPNPFNTFIGLEFNAVDHFYFTYTAPNGCVYEGEFPGIPTCDENDNFNFELIYNGDPETDCHSGQVHTYTLGDITMGNNFPYFIEVTMVDAYDPSQSDYEQIIEVNSPITSIIIEGIPAGTVEFKTYNLCDDHFFSRTHINCCGTLSCDIINQGTGSQFGGYHYYDYPYFRIRAEDSLNGCFDQCGDLFDDECAKVTVHVHEGSAPEFNCWTGEVTITYPDGSTLVIEVKDGDPFDEVKIISGNEGWSPSEAGTHEIGISYVGSGASSGENCQTELLVNWYGDGNYNDVINFHTPFNPGNIPDEAFREAYSSALPCETCQLEYSYHFGPNGDCESIDIEQYHYFEFTPFNYTVENPCEEGGTLEILDFDDDGVPVVIEGVFIPSNVSLGHLPGEYPPFPSFPAGFSCSSDRGWCLFDANLEDYPIYEDVSFDQPILAWYADCSETTPSGEEPCGGNCSENEECDPITGICSPICDGDYACPIGEICNEEDGICVPEENNECECLPGYQCIEGECYLEEEICSFYREISGGIGFEPRVFNFSHDLPAGSELVVWYNTIVKKDRLHVFGSGIDFNVDCVSTQGWKESPVLETDGGSTITVEVTSCDPGAFLIEILCNGEMVNENPPSENLVCGGTMNPEEVFIDPNPFSSEIRVETEVLENFNGEVRLYNSMGYEIYGQDYALDAGHAEFTIDGLGTLPPSLYTLTITKDGELCKEKKLIKTN